MTEIIEVYKRESVDALIEAVQQQIPAPLTRDVTTGSTTALPSQATESLTLSLGRTFLLFSASTNAPARVRLYSSNSARAADLARLTTVSPTGEHGLILEVVTTQSNLFIDLAPITWGCAFDGENVFASVTNLAATTQAISVDFTHLVLEG